MKLFRLTIDFTFKAVFGGNPDLLTALLNSFPQFQNAKQIKSLVVLNPEISKEQMEEKLSILDIKAQDREGNQFLIEMQAFPQSEFPKRALYYWSKSYSSSLRKGHDYDKLKKVYSFNFLNFILFKNHTKYLSSFELYDRNTKTFLTEDLEINIIELPKFLKQLSELTLELDVWLYLLKSSQELKGETMKILERKNPKIKEAISELRTVSLSKKNRELYESRRKAELDYNTNINSAFRKGKQEGREVGSIESLYMGIQLILESRFNSKGLALMPLIEKIKDIAVLKQIMKHAIKSNSLDSIKVILSK